MFGVIVILARLIVYVLSILWLIASFLLQDIEVSFKLMVGLGIIVVPCICIIMISTFLPTKHTKGAHRTPTTGDEWDDLDDFIGKPAEEISQSYPDPMTSWAQRQNDARLAGRDPLINP